MGYRLWARGVDFEKLYKWTVVYFIRQLFIKMEELKERLLSFFFEEPEREFYVRELARLLKKSPTTVSKYLLDLEKERILISCKKLGHLFFRASLSNEFKDIKFYFNLRKIRKSGLIEFLEEEFNFPSAIVLFGSFGRAENIKGSDVDLLVISSSKRELDFSFFEKKLGAKIELFVYSKEELCFMKNKELLNNFINGFVLNGYIDIFQNDDLMKEDIL